MALLGKYRAALPHSRQDWVRRGRRLEYFTLGWNLLEAAVAVIAGLLAGSTALVGFGLDSIIESFSGAALLWRLHQEQDADHRERAEHRALRLVGLSFFALAIYMLAEAGYTLATRKHPEHSLAGILLALASLVVMPLLARAKRRVAAALASGALHADSRQTDLCAYLSAVLLGGLLLNWLLGWWWADPVAALAMIPIVGREGWEAVRNRSCSCHSGCC
jgi:divalent metal cation (Fe/Co/Zn/Cd) transporter